MHGSAGHKQPRPVISLAEYRRAGPCPARGCQIIGSVPSHHHIGPTVILFLQRPQLGPKSRETRPADLGYWLVAWIGDDVEEFVNAVASDRGNDPELGKMRPDRIDHRGLLTDQQMARPMKRQTACCSRSVATNRMSAL